MGLNFILPSAEIPPSGQFLVGGNGTPFGTVFDRVDDSFVYAWDYSVYGGLQCTGLEYSHDDTYIVRLGTTNPNIYLFKSPNYNTSPLTIAALPNDGHAASWSSDSAYLAVGHSTSPYLTIYKRTGDTFTKLSDPATLPVGAVYDVRFDPTDTYLACHVSTVSTKLVIYKRSGDTFTKLANPSSFPPGNVGGLGWYHDSSYLAVASSSTPYITMYKRSGDVFTELPDLTPPPSASSGTNIDFSPDGNYLAVSHAGGYGITVYTVDSATDTFTYVAAITATIGGTGADVKFDKSGLYLGYAGGTSPYCGVYKTDTIPFTILTVPTGSTTSAQLTCSWSNT